MHYGMSTLINDMWVYSSHIRFTSHNIYIYSTSCIVKSKCFPVDIQCHDYVCKDKSVLTVTVEQDVHL